MTTVSLIICYFNHQQSFENFKNNYNFSGEFGDEHDQNRSTKRKKLENVDIAVDFGKSQPLEMHHQRYDDDKRLSKVKHSDRNIEPFDTFGSPNQVILTHVKERSCTKLMSPPWMNQNDERIKRVEKDQSKGSANKKANNQQALEVFDWNQHENPKNIFNGYTKANKGMLAFKAFTSNTASQPIVCNIKCNNLYIKTD